MQKTTKVGGEVGGGATAPPMMLLAKVMILNRGAIGNEGKCMEMNDMKEREQNRQKGT